MFAQDLCPNRIEYLRNAIDVNRKDRAKRFLQSAIRNPQSAIQNFFFRLARVGYNKNAHLVAEAVTGQALINVIISLIMSEN